VRDVMTVFRKEMKEWLYAKGGLVSIVFNLLIYMGIFGVVLPLAQVEIWKVPNQLTVFYFFFLPSLIASTTTADAFAGERERKTLETLLSTRLSDRAIFLGKLAAVFVYTATMLLAVDLTVLSVVNIADGSPQFFMFPKETLFALGPLAWIITLLVANLGLFISLKVPSARIAQQIGSFGSLVISLPFLFGLAQLSMTMKNLVIAGIILLAAVVLSTAASIALFQRQKLIQ
jgi:ABC-2 type transport system permease protein